MPNKSDEYETKNGIITSPGKFEGEPSFVPKFWNYVLEGFGEDIGSNPTMTRIDVEEDDRSHPILALCKSVVLWEDNNGFVWHYPETVKVGYVDCACPNCFEIAIGEAGKAFCNSCEECDCDGDGDCQADHCSGCGAYAEHAEQCDGCEYNLQVAR